MLLWPTVLSFHAVPHHFQGVVSRPRLSLQGERNRRWGEMTVAAYRLVRMGKLAG